MPPRLDLVGLVVRDLDASLDFYRRLGIDIPDAAGQDERVEATLPSGLRLAWDTVEVMELCDPGWQAPAEPPAHALGLSFVVDSEDEVDRLHDELVALGHRSQFEPSVSPSGRRYAVLADPDGNDVVLVAPLAAGG